VPDTVVAVQVQVQVRLQSRRKPQQADAVQMRVKALKNNNGSKYILKRFYNFSGKSSYSKFKVRSSEFFSLANKTKMSLKT